MADCVATARVCLTCLDTGREMFSMSEYNLHEAYEHLIGYPLFVNLSDTVCEECMHKLTGFEMFRDKSLKVRSLLMELVAQHKEISDKHMGSLRSALKSASVSVKTESVDTQESEAVSVKKEPADALAETETEGLCDVKLLPSTECRVMLTRLCSAQERAGRALPCGEQFICEREYSGRGTSRANGESSPAVPLRSGDADVRNHSDNDEAIVKREELEDPLSSAIDDTDWHEDYQTTDQADLPTSGTIAPVPKHTAAVCARDDSTVNNAKPCNDNIESTLAGSHVEKQVYVCDSCQCKYKQKTFLLKHIISYTKNNVLVCKKNPIVCTLCLFKCKHISHLEIHMRTHTGEKPFACKFCQFKCSTSSYLKEHIRMHTGEKRFHCKLCPYKCRTSGHLNRHVRIHTGEKPFACTLCQYKFRTSGHLKQHMRIHTGEKPFACTLCQYKCRTSGHLKQHMRKRHTHG